MAMLGSGWLTRMLESDGGPEAMAAATALHSGAPLTYYDADPTPGDHFATIYRRRAWHVHDIGLDARGLAEAVKRFEETQTVGAHAVVHADDRDYHVFLTPAAAKMVACISTPSRPSP